MNSDLPILIIGAGAAGVAAASRLMEKGLNNLLILEAKNRIGGRVHTVKYSENIVDMGAQWCHGEKDNVVFKLASPHNLLDSYQSFHDPTKHIFVNSVGEILSQKESAEILKLYYKINSDAAEAYHKPNTSFGTYFVEQFYKQVKKNPLINIQRAEEILDWMHKFENSIESSDSWFDVSATRLKDYWVCEGDSLLNWKTHGYCKVFDLLTKNYPDPKERLPVYEKVLFNKEILEIDYKCENEIKVSTLDGSVFKAKNVIFTPSLGVLKERYNTLFKPSLSQTKIQAIESFNIGVADKVFLEFSHRWWPKRTAALSFMWSEEQKKSFISTHGKQRQWMTDLFEFFTVDFQPRVLCGWLVGPSARYVEELSDEDVLKEFHFILKKFLGHVYDIPEPISILRSKWFNDKHTRGSYSYRSLMTEGSKVSWKDLADPIKGQNDKPIILFAGEATHQHYFSTVHGAIETGVREADRLVNYYECLKPRL